MNLTIGSGDISSLMAGKETGLFKDLMRKFLSDTKPNYNSFASPIDALRTGAILEVNYFKILPDGYFPQWKERSEQMDVFCSSIDFAKVHSNKCVDFDELKTIWLTDFIDIILPMYDLPETEQIETIKKKFKKYYEQVQIQLHCSGIESANLVFLSVSSYDDSVNMAREIEPNDFRKFRISKDEECIAKILKRGEIFQQIKDYFNER